MDDEGVRIFLRQRDCHDFLDPWHESEDFMDSCPRRSCAELDAWLLEKWKDKLDIDQD